MKKFTSLANGGFEKLRKVLDMGKRYPSSSGIVISGVNYFNSTGLIMRSRGKSLKLGYSCETPKQALEFLMPDFYVTSYCGMEFYSSNDVEGVPMYGISIGEEKFEGVYGKKTVIDGKLSEILELDEEIFTRLKRKESLGDGERLRIMGNISGYGSNPKIDQRRLKELVDFLTSRRHL